MLLALVLLAGCSGDQTRDGGRELGPPDQDPTPTQAPTTVEREVEPAADEVEPTDTPADPDPKADPTYSARGNVVKEIGEMAGLVNENDEFTFRMRVTEVDPDPDCGADVEEPSNGRLVALNIEAETTDKWHEYDFIQVTMHDFRAWTKDGMRVNDVVGSASSCEVSNRMNSDPFHPNEKASGVIVLDVPEESVWVAFEPLGDGGWEFFVD